METKNRLRIDKAAFMTEKNEKTQLSLINGIAAAWHSENPSVATVDENGIVTATGEGDTVIKAVTANGETAVCIVSVGYHGQNPILPPTWGLFIADGEPHVFEDRMYIFGSRDNPFGKNETGRTEYCSGDYHVIYSDDLIHWTDSGVAISVDDFPEHMQYTQPNADEIREAQEKGEDIKPIKIEYLWAPDLFKDPHKEKYYLTFCSGAQQCEYFIAESNNPTGPFVNIRYLTDHGNRMRGIDPGVLVDDDGRVYIAFPKPFRICELNPDKGYAETIEGSTIHLQDLVADSPDGYYGFEGPSMRKINGYYYFIYIASQHGKSCPTRMNYLISKNIKEDWQFGGTIIDTFEYLEASNVHGSLEPFRGDLYLAYHRMCPSTFSRFTREMSMEKISIGADGHLVPAIMTSSGVRGAFIRGDKIHASTAVYFSGGRGDMRFLHRGVEKNSSENNKWYFEGYPYAFFDKKGQYNGYRYIDLTDCSSLTLSVKTNADGAILSFYDALEKNIIAHTTLPDSANEWVQITVPLNGRYSGVYELTVTLDELPHKGKVWLDWFRFH